MVGIGCAPPIQLIVPLVATKLSVCVLESLAVCCVLTTIVSPSLKEANVRVKVAVVNTTVNLLLVEQVNVVALLATVPTVGVKA